MIKNTTMQNTALSETRSASLGGKPRKKLFKLASIEEKSGVDVSIQYGIPF